LWERRRKERGSIFFFLVFFYRRSGVLFSEGQRSMERERGDSGTDHDANRHKDTVGSDHAGGMNDDERVADMSRRYRMGTGIVIVHVIHVA
jgi:hypothetical protein